MSSGSPSPSRRFYAASGLVAAVLLVGIVLLAFLVTSSGPRVRGVVVQNRPDGEVAVVNQGLTVLFDRPIRDADLDEAITLEPEAEYEVSRSSRQVSILFGQNLRSGTAYTLGVGPELEDGTGERMAEEYSHEFTTAEPAFSYLERDHATPGIDEVIERSPVSGESRALFAADKIESFARGEDHLAAVLPHGNDAADELVLLDLASRERTRVDFPGNVKVTDVAFSPVGGSFVFITRANIGRGADEAYREGYDGRLYSYDMGAGKLQQIETLEENGVESVRYSRDGQVLLFGTVDGAYFLTDAVGNAEPVLLGNYADSGGFDGTSTRILFKTNEGAAVYDAETRRMRTTLPYGEGGGSRSTPSFLYNSDGILFTESFPDPASGGAEWRVLVAGAPEGEPRTQFSAGEPTYFFDEPVVSFDDRYIAVETASAADPFDSYAGNSQPEDATVKVFDRGESRIVDEVRGIDPVWSR